MNLSVGKSRKPDRTVRCVYCGREFIEPIPHRCNKNYRKRNLKWINIMEEEKRKRFNVADFISNEETPVETSDGRKVEIFTTSREKEDTYVVVGAVDGYKSKCEKYSDYYTSWTKEGRLYSAATESVSDLFFSVKKKTHRMTNQELARWLREHQEEHREFRFGEDTSVFHSYPYRESSSNCPCEEGIFIRSNGGEWKEPEIEIEEENDKRD